MTVASPSHLADALIAIGVAAVAAWGLADAIRRGEIDIRGIGRVTRLEHPLSFRGACIGLAGLTAFLALMAFGALVSA